MRRDFGRVAIVNRGEPAMRLIHAAREQERERGARLATIALYTEPDRRAMFVREAEEAFCIGPATFVDPRDGQRRSGYLDYAALERALVETRADAAWVGWGFVAEHAAFAELCERLGVVFIGPPAAVMRRLGDKIASKRLAEEAGVAVAPWSRGPVEREEQARAHAERIGFPLMIKATAGGGGRGIREVRAMGDLAAALESARAEARAAFGDPTVFLERRIEGARHVEAQIMGDTHGNVWACGVRDCTIQRRHQKILEEAPSPVLSEAEDARLREASARLAKAAGYEGAGTVEFLYEPWSGKHWFMEVNARLQVEHPVTELTTGLDLVKLQLHVARGGALEREPPAARGHAIEVRLNAEDPDRDFAPSPGRIDLLRIPTGPGLRVDRGVAEGDEIAPEFDSMIAKIIAHGQTRTEALSRLSRALSDSTLVIRGGTSNKAFLLDLVARPELVRSEFDNGWMDRLAARGEHVSRAHADVALIAVALDARAEALALARARFFASAARGRPKLGPPVDRAVELLYRGDAYQLQVAEVGPEDYEVDAGACIAIEVRVERLGRFERRLTVAGRRHRVLSVAQGLDHVVEVDGVPHRISRDAGGAVRAPTPAVVLAVPVRAGDVVEAGARVAVLEAMKMEVGVAAPFAGRVREVLVTPNVQVDTGAPLLILEPLARAREARADERVRFEFAAPVPPEALDPRARWAAAVGQLRRLLLGFDTRGSGSPPAPCAPNPFDVDEGGAKHIAEAWGKHAATLPPNDPELCRAEEEALTLFADVHSLFRRQPVADDPDGPEIGSTQEHLTTYLRALDVRGEGLPPSFLEKLGRALAHYGVRGLDPSPELEGALVRIHRARERGDEQAAAIAATLDRRLLHADALRGAAGDPFHILINRLIAVTHRRFPAVNDLAREVRHAYFDQPLFERAKRAVYDGAASCLEALAEVPEGADRAATVARLVECPQPLLGLLAERFFPAAPPLRGAILETLTRRYYRIRALERVALHAIDGHPYVTCEYPHAGTHIHAITTDTALGELAATARRLSPVLAETAQRGEVVVDFYAFSAEPFGDADALERAVSAALAEADLPRGLRRVVVVVTGPDHGMNSVRHFTYRPQVSAPGGYAEENLYRGLHPMIGKRLHLARLRNFDLERLPAPEDVYLFHGVARQNKKDERLFALVEIRDLTPVRDAAGRLIEIPYVERMLVEALAAIRLVQARRPARERLHGNRVLLYVWPLLDLAPAELRGVIRRLAPATEGLGIEQVVIRARMPSPEGMRDSVLRVMTTPDEGLHTALEDPSDDAVETLSEYEQKVQKLRRRGLTYPYEIIRLLTPQRDGASEIPRGEFVEHDLDEDGALRPVSRPPGNNAAHVVVGVIKSFTARYAEGMTRVAILGDPSKEMGSVAEPECRRIIAALDLAARLRVPVEWFALSAGAKISMQSGTENMDWIALVLRRLIEHTQAGGEVNVVVSGINVGAQPYWNAEATMLMHTRGILIMVRDGAMVLTGKQALDYSGSVSAEDNLGIGGYERIMGPNGQAQYVTDDIGGACALLLCHYEHTYAAPGERFPRRAETQDPRDRDVRDAPHDASPHARGRRGAAPEFERIGDVFSSEKNPDRKKPFDIRAVMGAVADQDHPPLERWRDMRDAEIAVIWDAHLGGHPVAMIGLESRPAARFGVVPADGPEQWTAGTLFPRSSKKVARAINSASGSRPLVVLANLSGFDGSPESMRELQLEYGAEIGRAVVNFNGPIVFCVISRYHGGAFVVFSKRLSEGMEVSAIEGARASVIGGAPAAAVVFSREVDHRTDKDPRVQALTQQLATAAGEARAALRARLVELTQLVRSEKLGQVADEFDTIHSVERALRVGSIDRILPASDLRPYLIDAVERGMARTLGRTLP